jgi:site-specific recombinase XerD
MNISDHTSKLRNYLEFRNYSKNTVDNYCSNFSGFLAHFQKLNITHPERISADMIITFLSQFKEPSTHSGYHSAIKIYYEKIARVGIEKFKFIERPRKNNKLPIVLSIEEIQRMFNVCDNKKHTVILALLYSCGFRVSELINLKWAHVDRSRGIINIIQSKNHKDRQVGLPVDIIPLLEAYYQEYKSKIYVLNGQSNIQYTDRSVGEVIKQLASKAKILNKKVHPHLIRHCYATHLLEAGTDINLIQKLLGHSNVKTTNIYLHISHNHISKIQSPLSNIKLDK